MTTAIKIFLILLIGVFCGYFWAYQVYQPLKLAEQIKELKADVQKCESRWVRDFSKKHKLIED